MILMLGPPGAGKSVQGGLLAAELGYVSISTGVLLRAAADDELHERMLRGELISDETVQELVKKEILKLHPPGSLILDGFPRTPEQAKWLVSWAKDNDVCIECLLHITNELDVCLERLTSRGRHDDKPEVVRERYEMYRDVAGPIIEIMVDAGIPVLTVDGSQSIELVRSLVFAQIDQRRKC